MIYREGLANHPAIESERITAVRVARPRRITFGTIVGAIVVGNLITAAIVAFAYWFATAK